MKVLEAARVAIFIVKLSRAEKNVHFIGLTTIATIGSFPKTATNLTNKKEDGDEKERRKRGHQKRQSD